MDFSQATSWGLISTKSCDADTYVFLFFHSLFQIKRRGERFCYCNRCIWTMRGELFECTYRKEIGRMINLHLFTRNTFQVLRQYKKGLWRAGNNYSPWPYSVFHSSKVHLWWLFEIVIIVVRNQSIQITYGGRWFLKQFMQIQHSFANWACFITGCSLTGLQLS